MGACENDNCHTPSEGNAQGLLADNAVRAHARSDGADKQAKFRPQDNALGCQGGSGLELDGIRSVRTTPRSGSRFLYTVTGFAGFAFCRFCLFS